MCGAFGLRGGLRIRYFAEGPEPLLSIRRVALGRGASDPRAQVHDVASVSPGRRGELRLRIDGVDDRDAAEACRGLAVLVEPEELGRLPEGEYYQYELLGCRVESHEGRVLGTVQGIWETGAADVLVVEGEAGQRHLVPAAAQMLRSVDTRARRIVVELPPGLVDEAAGEGV